MSRIQLSRERETFSYRASRLEGKLFLGEDTSNFIDYIENNYQHTLSYKQKRCFEKNKIHESNAIQIQQEVENRMTAQKEHIAELGESFITTLLGITEKM